MQTHNATTASKRQNKQESTSCSRLQCGLLRSIEQVAKKRLADATFLVITRHDSAVQTGQHRMEQCRTKPFRPGQDWATPRSAGSRISPRTRDFEQDDKRMIRGKSGHLQRMADRAQGTEDRGQGARHETRQGIGQERIIKKRSIAMAY